MVSLWSLYLCVCVLNIAIMMTTMVTVRVHYGHYERFFIGGNNMRVILYSRVNGATTVSFPDLLPEPEAVDSIIQALEQYRDDWTPEEIDEFNEEWTSGSHSSKGSNPPKQPVDKKSGYIYLAEWNGLHKIGRTKNSPENRIKQIDQGVPHGEVTLVLCAKISNYVYIEQVLLHKFSHKNTKGEWFNLDSGDIGLIREHLSGGIKTEGTSS